MDIFEISYTANKQLSEKFEAYNKKRLFKYENKFK